MLEIHFITVNKPDAKKAAKLLGPILYQMLEKERLGKAAKKPEHKEKSSRKPKQPNQLNSGDGVA